MGTKAATVVKGHLGAVRSTDFAPDSRLLLTTSDDKTAKVGVRLFPCHLYLSFVDTLSFVLLHKLAREPSQPLDSIMTVYAAVDAPRAAMRRNTGWAQQLGALRTFQP